jgi:carbonic anhydrase/acetyltransferase-like protein (isoleucine patch superfamily)
MTLHAHHGAKPEVHPTAFVAAGAHLIGDVYVAERASIWFGAVLRGDVNSITIGRYSNVQDNTVIHADGPRGDPSGAPTVVGEHVTIGHACIIHGCTIGDYVLVGMGSVVMNHARVAAEVILGARALVSENKDVPTRSLVLGIPGKVVRELTEGELHTLRSSADHYAELAQTYSP